MELRKGTVKELVAEELEVMGFTIAGEVFGINASDVQEIMITRRPDSIPHTHRSIEGAFKLRDTIVTVINLPQYLNLDENIDKERELFIVTGSGRANIAFRVHSVLGLINVPLTAVKKPDKFIYGGSPSVVTGITEHKGKLLNILNLEKVAADVAIENSMSLSQLEAMAAREEDSKPILIAEDSIYLSKLITQKLAVARYTNMHKLDNGQQLWDHLEGLKDSGIPFPSLIITGLDMPEMDGHRLIELLKADPTFKDIPIIIFEKELSEKQRTKGKQLGVDQQIVAQDTDKLIAAVDSLLKAE